MRKKINRRSVEVKLKKTFYVRQRFVIITFLAAILTLHYLSRHALGNAIFLMVQKEYYILESTRNTSRHCPVLEKPDPELAYQDKRGPLTYPWSIGISEKVGLYYAPSYMVGQIVGGYFADKHGGKYVLLTSVLSTAVTSLLQPVVLLATNGSVLVVILIRFVQGGFEGFYVPAATSIYAHWAPLNERARLYTLMLSGLAVGSSLHNLCMNAMILATKDWTVPFYVYGCLSLVLAALWVIFGASSPRHCKFITQHELSYLDQDMAGLVHHERKQVPVKRILTTLDFWIWTIGMVGHVNVWYISLLTLKTYPRDILNLLDNHKGIIAGPQLVLCVTAFLFAWFSDWAFMNGHVNLTTVRKTFTNIGILGCPIYMMAATYAECDVNLIEVLFTVAMALEGGVICGIRLVAVDMSPNYAGFLTACATAVAMVIGALVTVFVFGSMTFHRDVHQYRRLFSELIIIGTLTTLIFVIFGRTYLKAWNMPLLIPKKRM